MATNIIRMINISTEETDGSSTIPNMVLIMTAAWFLQNGKTLILKMISILLIIILIMRIFLMTLIMILSLRFGWLHYKTDKPPTEKAPVAHPWIQEHTANTSGSSAG